MDTKGVVRDGGSSEGDGAATTSHLQVHDQATCGLAQKRLMTHSNETHHVLPVQLGRVHPGGRIIICRSSDEPGSPAVDVG